MTYGHPADVLTDLIGALGEVLRVKPEKIDPDQTFQSLGLDSLLMVEFVAVVNTRYGLRVRPTDLYDHPTPASFAREVKRAASSTTAAPAVAASAVAAPAVPAPAVAAPAAAAPRPAPVPQAGAAPQIAEVLREHLAAILCCDVRDIDTTAAFHVLGVDSIVGAEFIAVVNRTFGLKERAVLLYEHPNLAAMAAYIAVRTGAPVQFGAPARTPGPPLRPVSRPAARPAAASRPLPARDLDVLLDAVRDDRLTVDEALVLLARRS
ncbi:MULTISPECIES: phosphopantetheine-binding protein [unclassified Streptomyces]|uniref:phosphopantetheine-binding protein n=1 Tax=unclassified Streptomyces TaxID=2593676 RepID=UPI00340A279D